MEKGWKNIMLNLIYITLFPDYFRDYFKRSLAKKSVENKIVSFQAYNIRNYSHYNRADDYPYGGGRGMLIKIEPLVKSLCAAEEKYGKLYTILLSPQGNLFEQKDVERLLEKKNIVFICGHYEGVDKRIEYYVDEKISIGNFITMGGELPSLIISEAIIRAIPNFIHPESYKNETFSDLGFDHDSYTRPSFFENLSVPEVLKSGNHKEIEKWRMLNSIKKKENMNYGSLSIKKKDLPKLDKWRLIIK
jgi:tRNA (guanine37-N1)-methyltransferase